MSVSSGPGTSSRDVNWFSVLVAGLAALLCVRVIALYVNGTDLFFDEAQYWAWSEDPALGYFSKPPLIAWTIAATTALCGDGEACIRLAAPLIHGGTAVLVFLIAEHLFGKQTALLSGFAYATLPGVSFSSGIISTDVPLLFFWALALFFLLILLERPRIRTSLAFGAAIGLGLLAKYAMLYFLLGLAIAAFLLPNLRRLLRSRYGAIAGLTALIVFAPNIAWNVTHAFATVGHTASNASLEGRALFNAAHLLEFTASQFAVFGPILMTALILALARLRAQREVLLEPREPALLLVCLTLAPLGAACVIAFVSRANANWAAPAYVAATPLVLNWLQVLGKRRLIALSFILHGAAAILLPLGMAVPSLADNSGFSNALKRVRSWDDVGKAVRAREAEAPYSAIIADDREIMGELLYYARPRAIPIVMWDYGVPPRNQYELTMRMDTQTGAHALYVTQAPILPGVAAQFQSVEPRGTIVTILDAKRARKIYLYAVKGFQPLR